ncbi:hypothetical protein HDU93_009960 [Gonapodya sp. JEL0774]|nr:hypothetical protein HDU93_009960 [Gonapodya sp. JEL0774]
MEELAKLLAIFRQVESYDISSLEDLFQLHCVKNRCGALGLPNDGLVYFPEPTSLSVLVPPVRYTAHLAEASDLLVQSWHQHFESLLNCANVDDIVKPYRDLSMGWAARLVLHISRILQGHGRDVTQLKFDDLLQILTPLLDTTLFHRPTEETFQDMVRIAVLFLTEDSFTLEIAVGLGGTLDLPNARLPSYVVAPVRVLEAFHSVRGVNAHNKVYLRVFSAHNAAIKANEYPLTDVQKNAHETMRFLHAYLARFHPSTLGHVYFQTDTSTFYTDGFVDDLESVLQRSTPTFLKEAQRMGHKHGGEKGAQQAIFYSAAHPVIFKDVIKRGGGAEWADVFFGDDGTSGHEAPVHRAPCKYPDGILSIGGSPERLFNEARECLSKELFNNCDYHCPISARLISIAGECPVNYKDKHGDLTMFDLLRGNTIETLSRGTKRDLTIVIMDVARSVSTSGVDLGSNLIKDIKCLVAPEVQHEEEASPAQSEEHLRPNLIADIQRLKEQVSQEVSPVQSKDQVVALNKFVKELCVWIEKGAIGNKNWKPKMLREVEKALAWDKYAEFIKKTLV